MAILECYGLSKRFGQVWALSGVDLAIQPGRVVGLLGPNGSGKTTLIKLANGLLTPTSGRILIGGRAPDKVTKATVSYLPDREYLPDWMTVWSLLELFRDFYRDFDLQRAREMLARLSIPEGMTLRQLSKGTREKVQLILVMSRRASLYLLDEPIGGVDPAARDYILDTIIRNYDPAAAVVISTHLIADVEPVLDDVIFLRDGQVILQAPAEALREQQGKSVDQLFREVFRC